MLRSVLVSAIVLAGLLFAGSATPALADVTTVDLTISYFPSAIPPSPIFPATSQLTGAANFYIPGPSATLTPLIPPSPINVAYGGNFVFSFQPTDPCVGAGTCQLSFSFGGSAAGFSADAFPLVQGIFPGTAPASPPILPVGTFSPGDPCFQALTSACQMSGQILAFDSPVQVGFWTVTISSVPSVATPEPSTLLLLGIGFPLLLAGRRLIRPFGSDA